MIRLSALTAVVCAVAAFADDSAPRPNSPLLHDGDLRAFREPVEKLLSFTLHGASLRVDRESWEQIPAEPPRVNPALPARIGANRPVVETPAVERVFAQFELVARAASRGGFSSGSSGGGQSRQRHFSGDSLRGTLVARDDNVHITLEEALPPARTLDIHLNGSLGLRLLVTHPAGDMLLLQQSASGKTAAVVLQGEKMFAGQGESFWGFVQNHREPVKSQILPVLDQFGINLFPATDTPALRRAAVWMLSPPSDVRREGQQLLADLGSDDFATREKSSERLQERFDDYRELIQEWLRQKSLPLEVQTRLQTIVEQQSATTGLHQAVNALELLQDPLFLVSLFDDAAAAGHVPSIIRQLELVTGQRLGSDPAGWKAWAKDAGE